MSNSRAKENIMPQGFNRKRGREHLTSRLNEFRSWADSKVVRDRTKDLLGLLGFLLCFTLFIYMLLH